MPPLMQRRARRCSETFLARFALAAGRYIECGGHEHAVGQRKLYLCRRTRSLHWDADCARAEESAQGGSRLPFAGPSVGRNPDPESLWYDISNGIVGRDRGLRQCQRGDASARYFIDPARRQKIDVTLQNLFDKTYATGLGTGTRDADGSFYTFWNLGCPAPCAFPTPTAFEA